MDKIEIKIAWAGALPALLAVYSDGSTTGRSIAIQELKRMAEAADRFNELACGLEALVTVVEHSFPSVDLLKEFQQAKHLLTGK